MLRSALVVGALLAGLGATPAGDPPPACDPGGPPVTFDGTAGAADVKTYRDLAFGVGEGATRVEVTYDWAERPLAPGGTPIAGAPDESTFDLGLWDERGLGTAAGFRGWSGSRGGRVATGQEPVFVQPDVAARGYVPGPIGAGTWFVDLGIAALSPGGADWTVTVTCSDPEVGPAFEPAPVDADHVAATEPGWYHGDLHMHGYHSNPDGPAHQTLVDEAVAAGLDIVFLTEYVTGQHWNELGPVQEANPDVLIWPGREIITYFGHAMALGETPSVLDYRHGADGVSLADIQAATVADGALFQVNHPTTFPEAEFGNVCRGCEFTLDEVIDWELVTTYEVLNVTVDSPFVQTALDEWEGLLLAGHRLTAVSGSDSKGQEESPEERARVGYGSSATAIYAEALSRPAVADALRAGHAYIRTRGVDGSPEVEVAITAPDGTRGMVGDTVVADEATLEVTVRGGAGQQLVLSRDGEPFGDPVPIDAEPFTYTAPVLRDDASGPLGTFFRVDTRDTRTYTTIGNPVFLADRASQPAPPTGGDGDGDRDGNSDGDGRLPLAMVAAVAAVLGAGALVVLRRRPPAG
jgi:hypothetical protein